MLPSVRAVRMLEELTSMSGAADCGGRRERRERRRRQRPVSRSRCGGRGRVRSRSRMDHRRRTRPLWVCGHVYNACAAAGAERRAEGHSDGYGRKRGVHQVNAWIAAGRIRRTKGSLEDSRHSSSERVEEAARRTGFREGNHRSWQAQGMKKGNKRSSVSAFVTHCVRVYREARRRGVMAPC